VASKRQSAKKSAGEGKLPPIKAPWPAEKVERRYGNGRNKPNAAGAVDLSTGGIN
jgi:hypothetical protein